MREWEGGGYAFATRDRVEIHLGSTPAGSNEHAEHHHHSTAYIWVDDADELAAAWQQAGADVHLPEDTAWGQHEGAMVDPDGNVIRFGSPSHHHH